jgi:hypothetical protein
MVFSENLLLGLIRVHQPTSEPEVLLKHSGRSVADLEREVQGVSGHHRPTQSPYSLTDLPRLSRNTQMAMDLATRLSEELSPGGTISAPILFGGLLTQSQSFAYVALQAALGPDVDLAEVAQRYVADFLPRGPQVSYVAYLDIDEKSSRNAPPEPKPDVVAFGPRDQVEWVADAPASKDLLKRHSIADAIAQRLRRIEDEGSDARSFLVHIDGPWGSGKSTLLEFLREDLGKDWLIVQFNAWRQSRVGPPWWSMLTRLRYSLASSLSRPSRFMLRWSETRERIRRGGAPYVLSLVLLGVAAVGLFVMLRPQRFNLGDATNVAESIGAIGATLVTLWGGALILSKFLLWDSAAGARLYEQSQQNPMESLAAHFDWLVRRAKKPVAFFIDDLDRCDEKYVVDLLESVQTLIRDAPTGQRNRPRHATYFVVTADGAWLRRCYETDYRTFADAVGQPGRSIGYLFLDKIFQLTVPIPWINASSQQSYIRDLLGLENKDPATMESEKAEVGRQVQRSKTRDEGMSALKSASPEVRRELAPELVKKLNDPVVSNVTEHSLTKFATLLEPNPRAMKRFLNAFSIADSVLLLQDVFVGQDELALWTILRLRWPGLGDYLRANPDAIARIAANNPVTDGLPADLAPLFTAKEVASIVKNTPGGPLSAESVRRCSGIKVDDRVLEATVLKP